jgi:nicotianamine synthase
MFEKKVRSILEQLRKSDLRPGESTNKIFSELVSLSVDAGNDLKFENSNLLPKEIHELRQICSDGEYNLELYWNRMIVKSDYPHVEIMKFPYYENYRRLAAMEFLSLKSVVGVYPHKMLIIGGGPLPLSGIIASQEYGVMADYLDISPEATELSNVLNSKLLLDNKSICADAFSFDLYDEYDTILVAALVGVDGRDKARLLNKITKQISGNTAVIVRTAEGARRLLYPEFESNLFPEKLKEVVHVIPKNKVVNSFKIALRHEDITNVKLMRIDSLEDSKLFRQKALQYIHDAYGYGYKQEWHQDLDNAYKVYNTKGAAHWLIILGNTIIGTVAIRPNNNNPNTSELWRFFIDRHFEETSAIAHIIWPTIVSFLKEHNYSKVDVHDQKHVPGAVTHYLNLGFNVTSDPGDEYKTVYMEKIL